MKLAALLCGKQRAIHGPAVNVPTNLIPLCTLLPRLPSQTKMANTKLKKKSYYKDILYEYIQPGKVHVRTCSPAVVENEVHVSTVQGYLDQQ